MGAVTDDVRIEWRAYKSRALRTPFPSFLLPSTDFIFSAPRCSVIVLRWRRHFHCCTQFHCELGIHSVHILPFFSPRLTTPNLASNGSCYRHENAPNLLLDVREEAPRRFAWILRCRFVNCPHPVVARVSTPPATAAGVFERFVLSSRDVKFSCFLKQAFGNPQVGHNDRSHILPLLYPIATSIPNQMCNGFIAERIKTSFLINTVICHCLPIEWLSHKIGEYVCIKILAYSSLPKLFGIWANTSGFHWRSSANSLLFAANYEHLGVLSNSEIHANSLAQGLGSHPLVYI